LLVAAAQFEHIWKLYARSENQFFKLEDFECSVYEFANACDWFPLVQGQDVSHKSR
jgi:hypothetical protein